MTTRFRNMALASAFLAGTTSALAAGTEEGTDNLGVDFYQQNDFYTNALNKPQSTSAFYEQQVNWMLENKYPPASIIMSSVSRGMTLPDAAFFMSQARPERAREYYDLAMDIMPVLPGWACSADSGIPNRYDQRIRPEELPPEPSLRQLSSLYFDEGKRFMKYPQWEQNKGHADITVNELLQLKQEEMKVADGDSWWYRQDQRIRTDVTMVSLYPTDRRVVIDTRHEELQEMKNRGVTKLPVMILYAEEGQIPVSDLYSDLDSDLDSDLPSSEGEKMVAGRSSNGDGTGLVSEVIARFDRTRQRVSPTRDWQKGDHHLQAQTKELQNLFDIPSRSEIPEETWQRWERQLDEGLEKPLLVSIYEGAGEDRWLDEKGLVAVAADRGVKQLPVVFFYHANQRQVCGLPAACGDQLQLAVERGSGRRDLFKNDPGPPPVRIVIPTGRPGGSTIPASPN